MSKVCIKILLIFKYKYQKRKWKMKTEMEHSLIKNDHKKFSIWSILVRSSKLTLLLSIGCLNFNMTEILTLKFLSNIHNYNICFWDGEMFKIRKQFLIFQGCEAYNDFSDPGTDTNIWNTIDTYPLIGANCREIRRVVQITKDTESKFIWRNSCAFFVCSNLGRKSPSSFGIFSLRSAFEGITNLLAVVFITTSGMHSMR
jgi:hypothetical protein